MTQQIQLFTAPDGKVQLSVSMNNETVWLTQEQMGALFERERSVITKHIRGLLAERSNPTRRKVFVSDHHRGALQNRHYNTQHRRSSPGNASLRQFEPRIGMLKTRTQPRNLCNTHHG